MVQADILGPGLDVRVTEAMRLVALDVARQISDKGCWGVWGSPDQMRASRAFVEKLIVHFNVENVKITDVCCHSAGEKPSNCLAGKVATLLQWHERKYPSDPSVSGALQKFVDFVTSDRARFSADTGSCAVPQHGGFCLLNNTITTGMVGLAVADLLQFNSTFAWGPPAHKTDDASAGAAATISVPQFGSFEIPLVLSTTPKNPFDLPASVVAVFISPSGGTLSVQPFYYQNYTRRQLTNGSESLTPQGKPHFLLRFSPIEVGVYSFSLRDAATVTGVTNGSFHAIAENNHRAGFASVAANQQYFRVGGHVDNAGPGTGEDNGTALWLLGEDIAFPGPDPILTT
jgi:hypothetical protein